MGVSVSRVSVCRAQFFLHSLSDLSKTYATVDRQKVNYGSAHIGTRVTEVAINILPSHRLGTKAITATVAATAATLALVCAAPSAFAQSGTGPGAFSSEQSSNSETSSNAIDNADELSAENSDRSSTSSFGSSRALDPLLAPRGSAQLPDSVGSGDGSANAGWLGSAVTDIQSLRNGLSSFQDEGALLGSAALGSSLAGRSVAEEGNYSIAKEMSSDEDRGAEETVDHGPKPLLMDQRHVEGNLWEVDIWSPANQTVVTNLLLLPEDPAPAPSLVLMSGADGGAGGANWASETDYEEFFADKHVNVITPMGGGASMYANWLHDDAYAGRQQWQTYLGEEIPQILDTEFNSTNRKAIAGLSMSGGPSLNIAGEYPETFQAAGSFSGFPASSGLLGRFMVNSVISGGEGSSTNAYGLSSSDAWQLNDPSYDPSQLRSTRVFVGTSLGVPSANELLGDWGGLVGIEVVSQYTSNYFTRVAEDAGVDVDRHHEFYGAHTYSLFERQLYKAWDSTFAPALYE